MDQTDETRQSMAGDSRQRTTQEAFVLQRIIAELTQLSEDARERMLSTVALFFGIRTPDRRNLSGQTPGPSDSPQSSTPYSQRHDISPKQFLLEKQPRTDVERIACLAYYLTHYRDTPFFKTLEISSLNTEAAQAKFSNAAYSVSNAAQLGYLVPASNGNKQLSAAGEQFVLALPDRDAAKAALARARPRRSRGRRGAKDNEATESELDA